MKVRGFTLIELLIVIAIVAILAGAMVPMFRTTQLTAQQARVNADLDSIKTASMMLHHDAGAGGWPAAVTPDIGEGLINDSDGAGGTIGNWAGPYMDEWINDPWGNAYDIYDVVGATTSRRVRSLGADGAIGGTGANADIDLLLTPDITM
ncbi:MAG: type II secretion system protein GspG [Candidatus Omnitrophota bacterium]